MLPMQIDRKVVENYLQQFLEQVAILDPEAFYDKFLFTRLQGLIHFHNKTWVKFEQSVMFLREQPLFSRLTAHGVTSLQFLEILPHLEVVEKQKGDLIFNDDGEHVHVVINGRVVLRYHEEDPLEYQYLAQYTPGKVLGHPTLDGGVSLLGQVFQIVVSEKCMLLRVKRDYFDVEIWARTKSIDHDIRHKILKQYVLTKELSDQTLYDILCSIGKVKLFKPDQLVLNCHPRSPMNLKARVVYDQEYGYHMKEELQESHQSTLNKVFTANAAEFSLQQSLVKSSPFGSFLMMAKNKEDRREALGISQEKYLKFRAKPYVYRKGNAAESNMRSLCIILDGSAKCVNKEDGFEIFEIFSGSHFGSSDLLKTPDLEYFGDMRAGKKGLKVLVVGKADQAIQLFERRNLQEAVKGKYDSLRFMIESKY